MSSAKASSRNLTCPFAAVNVMLVVISVSACADGAGGGTSIRAADVTQGAAASIRKT